MLAVVSLLSDIKEITIPNTHVDSTILKKIIKKHPNIEQLNIPYYMIDDKELLEIVRYCSNLKQLTVRMVECTISLKTVNKFRTILPDCKIVIHY